MKQRAKIFFAVLELSILGADFGIRSSVMLTCTPMMAPNYESNAASHENEPRDEHHYRVGDVPITDPQSSKWCDSAVDDQKQLHVWMGNILKLSSGIIPTILAGLLVVVGFKQARIANRQSEIMARQTVISEQAMTAAKQPRAILSRMSFKCYGENNAVLDAPLANYVVEFVGDTPAAVLRFSTTFMFGRSLDLVDAAWTIASSSYHAVTLGQSIAQMNTLPGIGDEIKNRIRGYDGRGGFDPSADLWQFFLTGTVIFDDVFGNQHEFGFCCRGSRGGGQGYIHGGPKRNYRRIRGPEERI